MILVTGATGITGSEVVRALQERGERPRAFVRDPDKARRLFGDRVELAVGDFADPQSVRAALDDVRSTAGRVGDGRGGGRSREDRQALDRRGRAARNSCK
jgi:uncharacterized protein YbjT (DUF2867 family)